MAKEETDETVNIASDNKFLSDNTNKVSLFNIENDFSGLAKAVLCFFPSMRHEMVLKYRAETIAKIGVEAYKIAQNQNIQINPIPPKIAMPLIEKMSLEHEPDMYEKWAKLLIAAGINPNPIYQQYADILANLNKKNANLMKEIYEQQKSPNIEKEYEEDINKSLFQKCYDEIQRHTSRRSSMTGENGFSLPNSFGAILSFFRYPLILHGTEKSIKTSTPYYENDKAIEKEYAVMDFTKEDNSNLIGLEKLGLIKYQYLYNEEGRGEDGKPLYIKRCGVLLTQFGYFFVDCLEHPTEFANTRNDI